MKTLFALSFASLLFLALLFFNNTYGQMASEPVQITFTGAGRPSVSPNGDLVVFEFGSGLAKISKNGGSVDTLTSFGYEPDWSTSNNLIVFRSESSLYTLDVDNGETTLLRTGGFDDDPAWSPNGNEIAVQGNNGIIIVAYPGGNLSTVTCSEQGGSECDGEGPTWSPDGNTIAFEDGLEILKVARVGGTAEVVVENLNDVTSPSWSSDGKFIAFSMEDATFTNFHIWITDIRGTSFGLWQITNGTGRDFSPAWSPNSDIIYFDSDRSGQYEIWKVEFNNPTSVGSIEPRLPTNIELFQNYPNPFNPETKITFVLRQSSHVSLEIFNTIGSKIKTLVNSFKQAGSYSITWDGKGQSGNLAPSGVYIYRLKSEYVEKSRKLILLR